MKKTDWLWIIGAIVGVPVIYKLVMWLVVDVQISPTILTAIFIYVVMVLPQYNAIHAMKLVNELHSSGELVAVKPNYFNWILFVNDFDLSRYFGTDNTFKLVVNWLMKISIPLVVLSVLYINLLVVFIDLGPAITEAIMYVMLISIGVYLITKTVIVIYFINMFKGIGPTILGLLHPIGFMFITWSVKHYLSSLEDIKHDEAMGLDYD